MGRKKKITNTLKTYVAFIVDESGSMGSIKKQTIDNFNEQLQVLKEESNSPENIAKKLLVNQTQDNAYEGIETFVSITKFNHNINKIINLTEVNNISEITDKDYEPDGTTNLYDAIGFTIEDFQKIPELKDDPKAAALFIILTDGEHNVQGKYNGPQVKSLISELEATNKYTFTFMGTDNALDQAQDLGLKIANTVSFSASAIGMDMAKNNVSVGLKSYYGGRKLGKTTMDDFYADANKSS
jgi:Mg-chelatase subunit ChlD